MGKLNIILSLGAPRETGGAETHAPSLKSLMQLKKKYDAPDVASLPDGYKQNSDKGSVHVIKFDEITYYELWNFTNFDIYLNNKYNVCLIKNRSKLRSVLKTDSPKWVVTIVHFTTISGHFLANSFNIFHKTQALSIQND